MSIAVNYVHCTPGEYSQKNWVGGVRPAFQNPNPIYESVYVYYANIANMEQLNQAISNLVEFWRSRYQHCVTERGPDVFFLPQV